MKITSDFTIRRSIVGILLLTGLLVASICGCASTTLPPSTGFLSTYSNLENNPRGGLVYRSDALRQYTKFMIDPVVLQTQMDPAVLTPEQAAEVAQYFREATIKVLVDHGYALTDRVAPGVARIRIAITRIQKTKWYLNIHPASKLTGRGTGGASMEAEVIDAVSGEQLGAFIKEGHATQFKLDSFSTIDDVKEVIDRWAQEASNRIDEVRRRPVR